MPVQHLSLAACVWLWLWLWLYLCLGFMLAMSVCQSMLLCRSSCRICPAGEGMSPEKYDWADQGDDQPAPPNISRSDTEFATSIGVEFVETTEGVNISELNELFEKVCIQSSLQRLQLPFWSRASKDLDCRHLCNVISQGQQADQSPAMPAVCIRRRCFQITQCCRFDSSICNDVVTFHITQSSC